jgi:hypothetical protein
MLERAPFLGAFSICVDKWLVDQSFVDLALGGWLVLSIESAKGKGVRAGFAQLVHVISRPQDAAVYEQSHANRTGFVVSQQELDLLPIESNFMHDSPTWPL